MKKFKVFFIFFIAMFISGCDLIPQEIIDEIPDEAPEFINLEDKSIVQGSDFDLLDGIEILDDNDVLTIFDIEVEVFDSSGTIVEFDTSVAMDYYVSYTVSDILGNVTSETIVISVIEKSITSEITFTGEVELIVDCSFEPDFTSFVTAMDSVDGDISDSITYTMYIDDEELTSFPINTIGEVTVIFEALNSRFEASTYEMIVTLEDVTPPELSLKSEEPIFVDNDWYSFNPTVYINIMDNVDMEDINSVSIKYTPHGDYEGRSAGQYTAEIRVKDKSDNESIISVSYTIVDVTSPTITRLLFDPQIYASDEFDITDMVLIEDETGIESYEFQVYQNGEMVSNFDSTTPGEYMLEVTATDAAGNTTVLENIYLEILQNEPEYYLDIMGVELLLGSFYYEIIEATLTPEDICSKYEFNNVDEMVFDCETILSVGQNLIIDYTLDSLGINSVDPSGFVAEVTIELSDNTSITLELEFYAWYQDGTYWLEFDANPVAVEVGNIYIPAPQYTLEIASAYLDSMYYLLLEDNITATYFCENTWMIQQNVNGTVEDCILFVEEARSKIVDLSVVGVTAIEVLYDGQMVPAFQAEITLLAEGQLEYEFFFAVSFFLAEDETIQFVYHTPTLFPVDIPEVSVPTTDIVVTSLINQFYQDLYWNSDLSNNEFCEIYVGLDVDYTELSAEECATWRAIARTNGEQFEVGDIVYYAETETMSEHYIVELFYYYGTKDYKTSARFFIEEVDNEFILKTIIQYSSFYTENDEFPQEELTVDIDLATSLAETFYNFYLSDFSNIDFCSEFGFSNPGMNSIKCRMWLLDRLHLDINEYHLLYVSVDPLIDNQYIAFLSEKDQDGTIKTIPVEFVIGRNTYGNIEIDFLYGPLGNSSTFPIFNDNFTLGVGWDSQIVYDEFIYELSSGELTQADFCSKYYTNNPYAIDSVAYCEELYTLVVDNAYQFITYGVSSEMNIVPIFHKTTTLSFGNGTGNSEYDVEFVLIRDGEEIYIVFISDILEIIK